MRKIFATVGTVVGVSALGLLHWATKLSDVLSFGDLPNQIGGAIVTIAGVAPAWVSYALLVVTAGCFAFLIFDTYRARKAAAAPEWIPVHEAIARLAKCLGDSDEQSCFERTRDLLRQKAFDGKLLIRGRKQLHFESYNAGPTFGRLWENIPESYWHVSRINALATGPKMIKEDHTICAHAYAWEGGPGAPNHYAELLVRAADFDRIVENAWKN